MMTDQQTEILIESVNALRDEVRALRLLVESRTVEHGCTSQDAALLREIRSSTHDMRFTAAELILRAELEGEGPLYDAIIGKFGALNGRKLGGWLAKLEGSPVAGMTVQRGKNGRDGINWRIHL